MDKVAVDPVLPLKRRSGPLKWERGRAGVGRRSRAASMRSAFHYLVVFWMLLGLAILAVVGAYAYGSLQDLLEANRWVLHSRNVQLRIEEIGGELKDMQRAVRGYIITATPSYLEPYDSSRALVARRVEDLRARAGDNAAQLDRLAEVERMEQALDEFWKHQIETVRAGRYEEAEEKTKSGEGKRMMDAALRRLGEMNAEEERLLRERQAAAQAQVAQTFRIAGLAAVLVGGVCVASLLTVFREIRRREKAQQSLAAMNAELTEAYVELDRARKEQLETKDRVLSHVSHELRTPLNAIYQFTSILHDGVAGPVSDEQKEYLGIVDRNVKQLQTMIGDVLDATRAQAGKLAVEPEHVDLRALAGDLVRVLRSPAAEKGLALEFHPPDGLPGVLADPARVRQVLTNLLDNAIKFTPRDGIVRVVLGLDAKDAASVRITVRDSGPGLTAQACARVFDRMYQVEGGTEAGRKGLGLGLFICRELVARMNGKIWVESEPGQGAAFHVTLPVYAADNKEGSAI